LEDISIEKSSLCLSIQHLDRGVAKMGCRGCLTQGHAGAGGAAAFSALILGGKKGQEFSFILNSFHLSYFLKGDFLAL